VSEAGQVEVASEVLDELLDLDVIPAPERHAVEFHAKPRGGEAGDQPLIASQLLARSYRQRLLSRQPDGLPLDGGLRRRLLGHEEPLVGLRQAPRYGPIGGCLLVSACFTWWGVRSSVSCSARIDSQAR